MARSPRVLLGALGAVLAGCTTVVDADVRALLERQEFPVTMDATPEGCESIGMLAVRDTGFYPFGFVPVVRMSLQHGVEELVRRAQALGGHGVSQVVVVYDQPGSFLNLSGALVLDWFQSVTVTGAVWRRPTTATRW
ncbi:MAG: hypothetical protein AB7O97_09195 [Planctomycetota bacterium]